MDADHIDDVDMHEAGQLQHQDDHQQQQQEDENENENEDVVEQEDGEQDEVNQEVIVNGAVQDPFNESPNDRRMLERIQQNDPKLDDYCPDLYLDDNRAILLGRALLGNTALAELAVIFMGHPDFTSRGARAFVGGVAGSQIKTLCLEGEEEPPLEMSNFCMQSLRCITLDFPIGDEFATQLSESLKACKLLREFSLQVDRMTLRGAKALSRYLSVSPITSLSLKVHWGNTATASLDDEGTRSKMHTLFSEGVQHCQDIQDLHLYRILGDMHELATTALPNLFELTFVHVHLSLAEVELLAHGLSDAKQLHTLVFLSCRLNNEHMSVLSPVLGNHPSIKKLLFYHNQIGDAGVASFVRQWSQKSVIKELSLSSDVIGFKGAELLSKTLSNHSALLSLNLEGNKSIGYKALKLIGEALPYTKIQSLGLYDVVDWIPYEDVTCEAAVIQEAQRMAASKALLEGVRGNVHLQWLRFGGLNLPTSVVKEIDLYVKANSYSRQAVLWNQHRLPCGAWCHFLAKEKMTSSFMFLFLRELPSLVMGNDGCHDSTKGRKRCLES